MHATGNALEPLIARLRAIGALADAEVAVLRSLPHVVRDCQPGWEVARQGDKATHCCLIIDGTFCRFKMAAEGGRQILSYHIRGELPDLQSAFLKVMDHNLSALNAGTFALIPHATIRQMLIEHPLLTAKLLRESFIDSSVTREWLCNVGRRQAEPRVAHLICEMFTRHKAVGQVEGFTFPFGLTQKAISDSQGLSVVHVNRVLKSLKGDKLCKVDRGSKTITILDWEALQEVGDFDPGYLHIVN